MPTVRVLLAQSFIVAILAMSGCNSQKPAPPPAEVEAPAPSAADSLAAAKELAEIAKEKYEKALKQIADIDKLINRAREIGSEESAEKLEKTRARWVKMRLDAQVEWEEAKSEVKKLAKEVLR